MRMSNLISQTLRESPADTEVRSQSLLVRAGFIRRLGAGIYTLMPLGFQVASRIESILREEMDRIGGQEMLMPVIHPADIWKESNRWYEVGSEMGRFHDKNGRDMVLAFTHEEVITDIIRKEIQSHKQLPTLIYHIQTKWRDDPRPRAGLIRVREFIMKDSYSLDRDWEGLARQYRAHYQAYYDIFNRCGLPSLAVKSDVGMMGGKMAHEFMYLTPIGEDTLVICDSCGYVANRQVAIFQKPPPPDEAPAPLTKVATPDTKTIADLAALLEIDEAKTAKAVFYIGRFTVDQGKVEKFIFAIVRGDMDINETKLANSVGADELRPALEEEIEAIGAVPGYASPMGIQRDNVLVVIDDLVASTPNLVAGANEVGFHAMNVNHGRDYEADQAADLVAAEDGYPCASCQEVLRTTRGVELGNIFQLGTRYSASMGATYQDERGEQKPVIMGSYGIGVGRLLACIAEEFNDEYGLIWPVSVAPYAVHLIALRGAEYAANVIYDQLHGAGIEVLYDDREESPGVKFNDADLIGNPIRITVGKRNLENGDVELKLRRVPEKQLIPIDAVVETVQDQIQALHAELKARIKPMEYVE